MKRIYLTTLIATTLTSATFAQVPAPPATAPTTTTTTTTSIGGEKMVKPFSQADIRALQVFAEAMQFHIRMGDIARWQKEKDAAITEMGTKISKDTKDVWTPMVNIAQAHQVDGKNIPSEVSKSDKANIDKLSKVKEEKYSVEYLELFAKEAKHNAKRTEMAAKSINDPELKTWADGAVKLLAAQAEQLEAAHKEAKKKK